MDLGAPNARERDERRRGPRRPGAFEGMHPCRTASPRRPKCSRAAGGLRADPASPGACPSPRRPGACIEASTSFVVALHRGHGGRGLRADRGSRGSEAFDGKGPFQRQGPLRTDLARAPERLVEVIFDASNVGTSRQTHSVAAGKHDVSMGAMVARASPWTSTGATMSSATAAGGLPRRTSKALQRARRTVSRGVLAQGRRLSRGTDLASKRA